MARDGKAKAQAAERQEVEMDVKIHYALNNASHSMAVRLSRRVSIPIYGLAGSRGLPTRQEKQEPIFGKVPLKLCLKAICAADPKMYPSDTTDYVVKALKAADTMRQQQQQQHEAILSSSPPAASRNSTSNPALLSPQSITRTAGSLLALVRSPSKPGPVRLSRQAVSSSDSPARAGGKHVESAGGAKGIFDACGYLGCALEDPDARVVVGGTAFKPKMVTGMCRQITSFDSEDEDDSNEDNNDWQEDGTDDDDKEHDSNSEDDADEEYQSPSGDVFASASDVSGDDLSRSASSSQNQRLNLRTGSLQQRPKQSIPHIQKQVQRQCRYERQQQSRRWVLEVVLRMEPEELDGMRMQARAEGVRERREAQAVLEANRAHKAAKAGTKSRSSSIGAGRGKRSSSPMPVEAERGESNRASKRQRLLHRQQTEPTAQEQAEDPLMAKSGSHRRRVRDVKHGQRSRSLSPCEQAQQQLPRQRSRSPCVSIDCGDIKQFGSFDLPGSRPSPQTHGAYLSTTASTLTLGSLASQQVQGTEMDEDTNEDVQSISSGHSQASSSAGVVSAMPPPAVPMPSPLRLSQSSSSSHLQPAGSQQRRRSASKSPLGIESIQQHGHPLQQHSPEDHDAHEAARNSEASASKPSPGQPPMVQVLHLLNALQSTASSQNSGGNEESRQQARTLLQQLRQSGILQLLGDGGSSKCIASQTVSTASPVGVAAGPSPALHASAPVVQPSPIYISPRTQAQYVSPKAPTTQIPPPAKPASASTSDLDSASTSATTATQASPAVRVALMPAPELSAPKAVYHCYHCGREDPGTNAFWRKVEIADADWSRLPPSLIVKYPAAVKPGETPPSGIKVFVACKECGPAYNAWKEEMKKKEDEGDACLPRASSPVALAATAPVMPPPPSRALLDPSRAFNIEAPHVPEPRGGYEPSRKPDSYAYGVDATNARKKAHFSNPQTSPFASSTNTPFEYSRNMTQSSPARSHQKRLNLTNSSDATARNQLFNDEGMDYGGENNLPLNATPGTILAGLQTWTPLRRSPRKQPVGTQSNVNPYASLTAGDGSPTLSQRAKVASMPKTSDSSPSLPNQSTGTRQLRISPRQPSLTSPEGQTPARLQKALTNWSDSDEEDAHAAEDDEPDASPSPARRKASHMHFQPSSEMAASNAQLTKGPRQRLASKPVGPFMGRSPSIGAEGLLGQSRIHKGLRHVVSSPSKGHDDRDMDVSKLFSATQEMSASSPINLDLSWMNDVPAESTNQASPSKFLASLGIHSQTKSAPVGAKAASTSNQGSAGLPAVSVPDQALAARRPLPATVEDASSSVASSPPDGGPTPEGLFNQLFDEFGLLPASGIGIPGSNFDPSNINNIETYGSFDFGQQFTDFMQHNTPGFAAHVPPKQQQPAVVMQGPSFVGEQHQTHVRASSQQPLQQDVQHAQTQAPARTKWPIVPAAEGGKPSEPWNGSKQTLKGQGSSVAKGKARKSGSRSRLQAALSKLPQELQQQANSLVSAGKPSQPQPPPPPPKRQTKSNLPNADVTTRLLNLLQDPQMQAAILSSAER
ncbi:hypothetical protein K437DRAFT_294828 [Tilletiaria anomala UBC 951]|uniref:Uncharacterized protein n=1 Tax=Tilletiaria anomala (strain ATCC 24038 / CBS 436.72 / UBC 951) TaxID=1037660 RepID=A0A066VSR2_TILAU|nr:uncharacterized protein K437DRAFT_294828 [Tilletiaria anomala UBC 951]KDN44496.1 hypothetical protein K437DRAFT_294828 [Tilletiaria anomala UBC 951]